MNKIVYSTCIGSFAFNQNFAVIDRELYKTREEILKQGRETEQRLLKKHSAKPLTIEDRDFTRFYERICNALLEYLPKIREANLLITKNAVKNSVIRELFIVQSANSIKETDKAINLLVKRLREWFGFYLPEFSDSISDHKKFIELILQKDKKMLLKEINLQPEDSMGGEIQKNDVAPMIELAKKIHELFLLRESNEKYLEELMKILCPNITAVAGYSIGASLLAKAGSLKKMAELPASTIQVLGAEKAFFRHLKTGARPPKFGVIHEHPFISGVGKNEKGKMARAIADKISIAAKVDYFKGEFVGNSLRKKIEARFEQLKTQKPAKLNKIKQKDKK